MGAVQVMNVLEIISV